MPVISRSLRQCLFRAIKMTSNQTSGNSNDAAETAQIISELVELGLDPVPSQTELKNELSEKWIDLDHKDLLLPEQQQIMLFYYQAFGIHGLHAAIAAIARRSAEAESQHPGLRLDQLARKRRRDNPAKRVIILTDEGEISASDEDEFLGGSHVSWQVILEDSNKPSHESWILFYLASVPHEVLLGLLRGNLPEVARTARPCVREYLQLKDVPGTYAVFAATTVLHESGPGKGLSLYQFSAVIRDMELYIDIGNPESIKLAKRVDTMHGNAPDISYTQQRRYASGKRRNDIEAVRLWLDHWKPLMIKARPWIDSEDRATFELSKQRMRRCLGYAGLANKCADRCRQHFSHSAQESPIYGLYTAVLKHRYGLDFKPSESSFQILFSVRKEDVCLGELITTVLGGFLLNEGGLNRIYGGVNPGRPVADTPLQKHKLDENANRIRNASFQAENLAIAHQKGVALLKLMKPGDVDEIPWIEPDRLLVDWRQQGLLAKERLNSFLQNVSKKQQQHQLLEALQELQEFDVALENLDG